MIDLQDDATYVRGQLAGAVAKYARLQADPVSRANHPPVTRIDLDLWMGDGGETPPSARVCFDTVVRDGWDAVWTHEGFATIEMWQWKADFDAFDGISLPVRGTDGVVRTITSKKFDQTFHRFWVDALLAARDAGVFEPLPKAPRCEMNVVNNDCGFGWPAYDDAGLENMADPRENGTRLSPDPPTPPEQRLECDGDAYDLWIELNGKSSAAAISAVSTATGSGIAAARQRVESGEPLGRDVTAVEVRRLARLLRSRGLGFRTDPAFPHAFT